MITEDYVSFEIAKLLKEKGFDECIFEFYVGDSIMYARNGEGFRLSELPDIYYPHITHQMALAWLREVHKVLIVIDAYHADHWEGYIDMFEINIYSHASTIILLDKYINKNNSAFFKSSFVIDSTICPFK